MFGNVLLLFAIIIFFKKEYRYISIIIYLGFLLGTFGGFSILTNAFIDNYNADLAFLYTIVILPVVLYNFRINIKRFFLIKYIVAFNVFLVISCFYSYFHYNLSARVIFQAAHTAFLTLSIIIFLVLNKFEIIKIVRFLGVVTFIVAICYILQVLVNIKILPYPFVAEPDSSTGLMRYYNFPELLSFYLALSLFDKRFFLGNVNIYRIVFLLTVFVTLGRNYILANLLGVLMGMLLGGRFELKKLSQYMLVLAILLIPFYSILEKRFLTGDSTTNDLKMIANSEYQYTENFADATLAYRIAWIYERINYLEKRPLSESLFGLGFVTDMQPISRNMYRFNLGLLNRDTGIKTQLETPDIAWGNLLTRYGIIGIVFYVSFFVIFLRDFFRSRKLDPLIYVGFIYVVIELLGSFASANIGYPKNYAFFFLLYVFLIKKKYYDKTKDYSSNSNL